MAVLGLLCRCFSPSNPHPRTAANTAAYTSRTTNNNDDNRRALALHERIHEDLNSIDDFVKRARKELETKGSARDLDKLNRTVWKLKSQIVSKHKTQPADSLPPQNPSSSESASTSNQFDVNKVPKFEDTPGFKEFKVSFVGLPFQLRVCLVCFLTFPENETIKKRSLIYWWIGEGILPPFRKDKENDQGKTEEDFGNQFFDELIAKGFIEPVYQKCSLFVDSCRMPLSVRSALTSVLAETKSVGFTLDEYRYWLNVNECAIEEGPELFSDMEHIKILYLGRWKRLVTQQVSGKAETQVPHIEVTDAKFFEGLKNMDHLRFVSLRGTSVITELPEFILKLPNLKILDLRACYNLEVLPDGIGLLKSLTHLDMSECYFLDHMPKGLASLSELEVLKGFVIGESKGKKSCTLNDLAGLPKLRKLNIYTTMKEFPTEKQLKALQQFKVLRKLTISWGACSIDARESTATDIRNPGIEGQGMNEAAEPTKSAAAQPSASSTRDPTLVAPSLLGLLEKLDLQCFPGTTLCWLKPANLMGLKKLYISGGKFCDLGQLRELKNKGKEVKEQEELWSIEILRLKYLSELEMEWIQVGKLFPKLIYLEKVECPKLTNFQCDESGVWMKRT